MPVEARWSELQAQAKQPKIGQIVDEAMEAIERENPKLLKGILPKVYGQQKLDPIALGGLIDNIDLLFHLIADSFQRVLRELHLTVS